MKTNYHMLREFDMKPEHFGWLTGEEVAKIVHYFQLKERSNVELQNLRDFVVMYFGGKKVQSMENMDLISGIVGVIDQEKFNRGLEI